MQGIGWPQSTWFVAGVAIALAGVTLPVAAQTETPEAPASAPAPAISPQDPFCRAANRSTPVFESGSTISSALRLIPTDGLVRLSQNPIPGSQFVRISEPVPGFIQTAVLRACSTTPPPPRTACRYLKQPSMVNVRRQPKIVDSPSNVIGALYQNEGLSVILDQNGNVVPVTADGYVWVEIDMTKAPFNRPAGGTGWIFNSVVGSNQSNLSLCPPATR